MSRPEILVWLISTLAVLPASSASLLEQRIDELLRTSRAIEGGTAGIEVVQLGTGKVLYTHNEDRLFTPASNTKLFSTALALVRLGPDHRMFTRIYGPAAPDAAGRINGDLTIAGGGDPSMSFLAVPYSRDAKPADPMVAIEALADQVAAHGVRRVAGDIVGDDTAYPADFFPPGWAVDDPLWDYGAPVSALSLGDNSIRVDITPGAAENDAATIQFTPQVEYFAVGNHLSTAVQGPHRVQIRRMNGRQLEFSGTISKEFGALTEWLAVDDPALYTATALYDALTRRGIVISGAPSARHRYTTDPARVCSGVLLAERESPPLAELARVTAKVSQNLWAELMFREVARSDGGDGSLKHALAELKGFLEEVGLDSQDYVFEDGSGLSRLTLVKPDAVVRLLRFMRRSAVADVWMSLLPVGGEDGSLEKRFQRNPAAKNIHAKTGSLSHVKALSGYADSATFGEIAFSIIVNDTNAPASEVRDLIDKIGMILIE